jgi:hypothetical protein
LLAPNAQVREEKRQSPPDGHGSLAPRAGDLRKKRAADLRKKRRGEEEDREGEKPSARVMSIAFGPSPLTIAASA